MPFTVNVPDARKLKKESQPQGSRDAAAAV